MLFMFPNSNASMSQKGKKKKKACVTSSFFLFFLSVPFNGCNKFLVPLTVYKLGSRYNIRWSRACPERCLKLNVTFHMLSPGKKASDDNRTAGMCDSKSP